MNATIVLRSPSAKLLEDVAVEINNFCNTKHPSAACPATSTAPILQRGLLLSQARRKSFGRARFSSPRQLLNGLGRIPLHSAYLGRNSAAWSCPHLLRFHNEKRKSVHFMQIDGDHRN